MANPFVKKTWQNRLSEHPTRRQLVDVSTGNTQIVDVTRSEGQIYNIGDGFTQANMNDLENRIYNAFEDFDGIGALSHNIPRVVPKDITQYYNDGSLWNRLDGRNGFSVCEDIFVGDYFRMSRIITCPNCEEGYGGTDYVRIVDIRTHPQYEGRYCLLVIPTVSDKSQRIIACFGSAKFHSTTDINNVGIFYSDLLNNEIGLAANSGSTDSNATISQQLLAEFGQHLCTTILSVPKGIGTSGNLVYEDNVHLQAYLMSSTNLLGYPFVLASSFVTLNNIYTRRKDEYYNNFRQFSLFKFKHASVTAGNIHPESGFWSTCYLQDFVTSTYNPSSLQTTVAHSTNDVDTRSDPSIYQLLSVVFMLAR